MGLMWLYSFLIAATLGLIAPSFAMASTFVEDPFLPLRWAPPSLGTGGATVATADDASAFQINPAGVSRHAEKRILSGHSFFFDRIKNWVFSVNLLDGVTQDPLHWGFQFTMARTDAIRLERYILPVSYNWNNFVLVGISEKVSRYRSALVSHEKLAYSSSAGVLVLISDNLAVGASIENLVRSWQDSLHEPVIGHAGLSFNLRYLRLPLDFERNFSRNQNTARAGLELQPLTETFTMRGGFSRDITDKQSYFSGGASWSALDNLHAEFGYRRRLGAHEDLYSMGISFLF